MAIQAGYGGSISSAVKCNGEVRGWTLNRSVQLHDTTIIGATVRTRTVGLKDWDITLDFFIADGETYDVGVDFKEGSTITSLVLTMDDSDTWTGTGLVESVSARADVDSAVTGTMTIKANGSALTHAPVA